MKVTKEIVEKLLRDRSHCHDGEIIWRDSLQSTYQDVYDYLISRPGLTLESFRVKE